MRRIAQITMALVALMFFTPGSAQAEPFLGPYIGVEAGWASLNNINGVGTSNTAILGGYVGLRGQIVRRIIVGVEATADFVTSGSDRRYTGSGTVGYLFTPDRLVYLRAGYEKFDGATNLEGWLLGIGYEVAVWEDINFRLDYRYTKLDDTLDGNLNPVSNSSHQALMGFSLDF